jgi:LPXTG-site transpeptidase (sortase) family protein
MLAKTLTTLGILLLVASAVFYVRSRPVEKGDLDAALGATTTTVAPAPTSATTPPTEAADADVTTTTSAGPRIADLIRVVEDEPLVDLAPPVSVRVGGIEVTAPVVPVGVEPDGQMEIPTDVDEVGWYSFGPAPGEAGSAVLAGHVSSRSQGRGVFYDLKRVEPGDVVEVDHADGTTSSYSVVAVRTIDKGELPTDEIFSRDGDPLLTLITCGGSFSRSENSYDSNIVVVAVPTTTPSEVGTES